ncbi:phosphoribosylanthranilate isomerase [Halonatronum saccharophilum]|uniref:phosphoribosylanthranilate isomerase n=1 Tax=Halonatronum saccharophilum TaxID=150060 RepID=UPI000483F34A|nr:phosphoribosylanthranilate isomerase [Halonatronum saccharophilum]
MTKVKICGLTNLGDAKLVAELDANFLGFIFAPSPRKINLDVLKEISKGLSNNVKKVGVFANQEVKEVKRIAYEGELDYLQFHGDESPEYCQNFDLPIIKAFRVRDESYLENLKRYRVDKYLLDAYHPQKLGGVGETFNWELAKKAKDYGDIIIAGGLNGNNVKEVIKELNPFGVDVSSGVEKEVGVKDEAKVKVFIEKTKNSV